MRKRFLSLHFSSWFVGLDLSHNTQRNKLVQPLGSKDDIITRSKIIHKFAVLLSLVHYKNFVGAFLMFLVTQKEGKIVSGNYFYSLKEQNDVYFRRPDLIIKL